MTSPTRPVLPSPAPTHHSPASPWALPGHGNAYRDRVLAERERLRERANDLAGAQRQVLRDLLEYNAGTAFGREHDFGRLRTVDDFRRAVPVRDFTGLSPWIDRVTAGELQVLTTDDPVLYFTSSGSTGAHKRIPVTRAFMRTTFLPFYYAAWAPLLEHFPQVLDAPDAVLNLKYDPLTTSPAPAGGRPHIGASQVDFGAQFGEPLAAELGTGAPWTTLPVEVAPQDHIEKMYLRLRLAVQHDVRCVIGINPAMVAAVPYQLDAWLPRILKEVRDGTVGGVRCATPDPRRAAELESLRNHFGRLRPAHVWPRLAALFCWTTGAATLYLPALREEFGVGVAALPAPSAASEGPVAVALDRHHSAGTLVPTASLYEFLPADQDLADDSATLLPHELETGQDYHVVFSHIGGLYRYAVGDVVRVVDRHGGGPRLAYAGRGTRSDAVGERLRDAQLIRALSRSLETTGLAVRNAACRVEDGDDGTPRYRLVAEPLGRWSATECGRFADETDRALHRHSKDYSAARAAGRLGPPDARTVAPGTFQRDWHAAVAAGVRPTQVKDRLFRQDPAGWQRLADAAREAAAAAGGAGGPGGPDAPPPFPTAASSPASLDENGARA
ncbi:GH3 auxin-responsive promoter family protein [Streptomyces sp. NPDC051976]|uniref:GH3 family domain-containing protein n=1 Tax=Streptomyces sp. NPDC051976 TaxID=3154947 RepID=UPI003434A27A